MAASSADVSGASGTATLADRTATSPPRAATLPASSAPLTILPASSLSPASAGTAAFETLSRTATERLSPTMFENLTADAYLAYSSSGTAGRAAFDTSRAG